VIQITKPGKENSEDISKFRPVSLLNIGGKVLEKVLINIINHHIYYQDFMNINQYDFMPQRSTIYAAVTEIMAREVSIFDSCYTLIDYQKHIKTGRKMWFL